MGLKPQVRYQNVRKSNDNCIALMEYGRQKGWDLLFVGEPWVVERDGDFVTTQHHSAWKMLSRVDSKETRVVCYVSVKSRLSFSVFLAKNSMPT